MTPALSLRDVWRSRGRGAEAVPALRGVSLDARPGEVVLLQGPSGSGKTTLLAVAGGLLRADAGRVVLCGSELGTLDARSAFRLRAGRVGFVFQRPCLLERLSIRDNVRLAAALAGVPAGPAAREADALLERLGLGGLGARRPHELSGGQEQRAALVRALVHRPALVLADEPTACLDTASGRAVFEALAELARERGAAVLVATHDPRLARMGSRSVALVDGALQAAA